MINLRLGDCLEVMKELPANSVDSIVTDPPYGLSFMGKEWDHGVPGEHFWIEALRVAKPGAHLLAFGGTRTFHRLAVAIEDAGWEIRDCVMWVYGSGFPKSHDVSKAIDREAGATRPDAIKGGHMAAAGRTSGDEFINSGGRYIENNVPAIVGKGSLTRGTPATPEAARWQGWGTALKPAFEPIIVARKPLTGTVASNVLEWGTGAINVDGCRVESPDNIGKTWIRGGKQAGYSLTTNTTGESQYIEANPAGRWPANFIHDGSEEVLALMPETGKSSASGYNFEQGAPSIFMGNSIKHGVHFGDSGSAARFFYCAKASKRDRDEGCEGLEGMEERRSESAVGMGSVTASNWGDPDEKVYERKTVHQNHHPTVKPTDLMRYLCRLVTPPGGVILDPFMGSGSTGKAAVIEGFSFIGIDLNPEYLEIARRRIEFANSYLVELQPALEMAV